MKEGIKSLLLLLLIGTSLSLSYLLWASEPAPLPLVPGKYETPVKIGEERSWNDLLSPHEVLLHLGGGRHAKIYPDTPEYTLLWRSLTQMHFSQFNEVSLNEDNWNDLLNNREGIEYSYENPLPLLLLRQVLAIPDGLENLTSTVNKIWISKEGMGEAVYFLSSKEGRILKGEIGKPSDPTFIDVPQLLSMGLTKPAYFPLIGVNPGSWEYYTLQYLPSSPVEIPILTYDLHLIGEKEMVGSLFLDLSVMREITERDGSRIYTDGTKSLQSNPKTAQIRYYVPGYETQAGNMQTAEPDFLLDFMNQHRGWTGHYQIEKADIISGTYALRFREEMGGLSLYENQEEGKRVGLIELKGVSGHTTEYIRSLLTLGQKKQHQKETLPSGRELLAELSRENIPLYKIKSVEIGYHLQIDQKNRLLLLIPSYVVEIIGEQKERFYDKASLSKGGR